MSTAEDNDVSGEIFFWVRNWIKRVASLKRGDARGSKHFVKDREFQRRFEKFHGGIPSKVWHFED